jgi:hypothetical protein
MTYVTRPGRVRSRRRAQAFAGSTARRRRTFRRDDADDADDADLAVFGAGRARVRFGMAAL